MDIRRFPRVARSSQPRALGRNPVGIQNCLVDFRQAIVYRLCSKHLQHLRKPVIVYLGTKLRRCWPGFGCNSVRLCLKSA